MTDFVPDFSQVRSPIVEDFDGSALRAFKDCHSGERCFILGNGPSLQRTDLAPLADEITIGVNGIFYMTQQCGFTPTYYVVEDNHVLADNLARINELHAVAKFFPSKYRPIIRPTAETYFLPTDWSFYWRSSEWYERPRFSKDVSQVVYAGQTVTFMNIQLAAYMGCTEIYLVGVDYEYQIPESDEIDGLTILSNNPDTNHFHPDYFGKGKKWHLPKLDNVGKAMLCAREAVEALGSKLVNATIGGKLEVFPRVDFQELVRRPEIDDPNLPSHYLVARALQRAARMGSQTVRIDGDSSSRSVDAVTSASPLRLTLEEDADVVVRLHPPTRRADDAGDRRVLVLPGDPSTHGSTQPTPERLTEFIVDLLLTRRAGFLTRSLLELSPDGESILLPVLGRRAVRTATAAREFGLDSVGNLDEPGATRCVDGRSLSIERLASLAEEVSHHGHSIGVVDGYIYVQSRWRPTESPTDLWMTRRGVYEQGKAEVGLRT